MRSSIRCAWLVLVVCASARAGVIVVDPGGGPGGAALLQAAISAAQPGDILLLRPGDYSSLPGGHPQIVDKSLSLVVDGPPGSVVLSGLRIASSSPAFRLLLRGLHVAPAPLIALDGGGVDLSGDGNFWFEDCVFAGSLAPSGSPVPGLRGTMFSGNFPELMLVRCTLLGGDGPDEVPGVSAAVAGAPGADLQSAAFTMSIHECTIRGGRGGDGDPFAGGGSTTADGGSGLVLIGSLPVSILESTIVGGDEGAANPAATKPGSGITASIANIKHRDSVIQAGAVNGSGTPADDITIGCCVGVEAFPAAGRGLSVPSPLREGEGALLHAHGEVGDGVWILLGLDYGLTQFDKYQGHLVLESTLPQLVFLGTITAPSGAIDHPFHMSTLPAGTDGFLVEMQSIMTPTGGGALMGSGTALVWLDASI
jgi:hypothetical protein